jgi:hypothetical protein
LDIFVTILSSVSEQIKKKVSMDLNRRSDDVGGVDDNNNYINKY